MLSALIYRLHAEGTPVPGAVSPVKELLLGSVCLWEGGDSQTLVRKKRVEGSTSDVQGAAPGAGVSPSADERVISLFLDL